LPCVAMWKLTPPASAALDKLTVNVNVFVRLLPSVAETSSMLRVGGALQSLIAEDVFRGLAVATRKSPELSFVSVHPSDFRKAEFTLPAAGVGPEPSKQKSVVDAVPPYPT